MRLTPQGCRGRQRRLRAAMDDAGCDAALLTRREHVYWLTGHLHHAVFHAAAAHLDAKGCVTLVGAGIDRDAVAADRIAEYEPSRFFTIHQTQHEEIATALASACAPTARLGAEVSGGSMSSIAAVSTDPGATVDLMPVMVRLRKAKDTDEVDAVRDSIRITEAMYDACRATLGAGVDEVDVLAQIRAGAIRAAGEDLDAMGNDFRANDLGGPARRRPMAAGEIYILDAGPMLHGYFADNCRSFVVGGRVDDAQQRAWETVDALFPVLEAQVRPGLAAADLYREADGWLKDHGYEQGLIHHLGHGLGLAPHETPQLNPAYDARFEAGDLFTMEPGLYAGDLRAGMRLEENYWLGEDGLQKLTQYPRQLT